MRVVQPCAVTEADILKCAVELGAADFGGPLSAAEQALTATATATAGSLNAKEVKSAIESGLDPLGDALIATRTKQVRRALGAFYTPDELVRTIVDWARASDPARVVDAGSGSGRFAVAAARRISGAEIVAIEVDPLAAILTRANLKVARARKVRVLNADYTSLKLDRVPGRTAFIGNPPYVRHQQIDPVIKRTAGDLSRRTGHKLSGLSSLHAYFFLATATHARVGDVGCFITSAGWLDVRYGGAIRDALLNGLGGTAISAIDAKHAAFEGVMTTALLVAFEVGREAGQIFFESVPALPDARVPFQGRAIPTETFALSNRWSELLTPAQVETGPTLGQIARVSRGIATGANAFFVMDARTAEHRGIIAWCRPVISRASEIIQSDGCVRATPDRRLLLVIPRDVDRSAHPALDSYLRLAEEPSSDGQRLCDRYLLRKRTPWWYLGIPRPAPVVVTYMRRGQPRFAANPDGLLSLNIAHGVYPRGALSRDDIQTLVQLMNGSRSLAGRGRTYQGGMEKFEPSEMEALPVPPEGDRLLPQHLALATGLRGRQE